MKTNYLSTFRGSNVIRGEMGEFTVKYFRTVSDSPEGKVYGVSMRKFSGAKDEEKGEYVECIEVDLTDDRNHIDSIINELIAKEVCVEELVYVVDEIYDSTCVNA